MVLAAAVIMALVHGVYPAGIMAYMHLNLPTNYPMTYSYWFEIASWYLLWMLLFFLSKRFWFSLAVVLLLFVGFVLGNMEKMRLLHAPLMLSDFAAIKELALQKNMFFKYLGYVAGFFVLLAVVGFFLWRKSFACKVVSRHQGTFILLWTLVLVLVLANRYAISDYLRKRDLFFNKVNPVLSVFQYGGLTTLLQAALFTPPYKELTNYNKQAVADVIRRYGLASPATVDAPDDPVNVVLVLTEAFTDPQEMGWETTTDAVPTFHAARQAQSGRLLSPVLGGRSANAEFELLTGFSLRFAPANSIPYTDLIKREIPSLARFLNQAGYLTMAIHVASLDFFNYKDVYKKLGFGMFTTLWDKAPKADPMGMHASRQDFFSLLAKASEFHKPFFIFTFPNYTHGDWRYDSFDDATLDVIDPDGLLQGEEKKRVKTYINALNYTDKLFQDLIAYFSRQPDKTMVVMLGDHQPFLEGYRQKVWQQAVAKYGKNELAKVQANYWVPVAIWRNYTPARPPEDFEFSMNFMPSYLIQQLGLQPTGFYRFNQILRDKIGVLSWIIKGPDGDYSFQVPPAYRQYIKDYELIQYDVLQGKNYFGQLLQPKH